MVDCEVGDICRPCVTPCEKCTSSTSCDSKNNHYNTYTKIKYIIIIIIKNNLLFIIILGCLDTYY